MSSEEVTRLVTLEISRYSLEAAEALSRLSYEPAILTQADEEHAREQVRKILERYYWAVREKSAKKTSRTYLRQGLVDDSKDF